LPGGKLPSRSQNVPVIVQNIEQSQKIYPRPNISPYLNRRRLASDQKTLLQNLRLLAQDISFDTKRGHEGKRSLKEWSEAKASGSSDDSAPPRLRGLRWGDGTGGPWSRSGKIMGWQEVSEGHTMRSLSQSATVKGNTSERNPVLHLLTDHANHRWITTSVCPATAATKIGHRQYVLWDQSLCKYAWDEHHCSPVL
jgi:hypothetical protein